MLTERIIKIKKKLLNNWKNSLQSLMINLNASLGH